MAYIASGHMSRLNTAPQLTRKCCHDQSSGGGRGGRVGRVGREGLFDSSSEDERFTGQKHQEEKESGVKKGACEDDVVPSKLQTFLWLIGVVVF